MTGMQSGMNYTKNTFTDRYTENSAQSGECSLGALPPEESRASGAKVNIKNPQWRDVPRLHSGNTRTQRHQQTHAQDGLPRLSPLGHSSSVLQPGTGLRYAVPSQKDGVLIEAHPRIRCKFRFFLSSSGGTQPAAVAILSLADPDPATNSSSCRGYYLSSKTGTAAGAGSGSGSEKHGIYILVRVGGSWRSLERRLHLCHAFRSL